MARGDGCKMNEVNKKVHNLVFKKEFIDVLEGSMCKFHGPLDELAESREVIFERLPNYTSDYNDFMAMLNGMFANGSANRFDILLNADYFGLTVNRVNAENIVVSGANQKEVVEKLVQRLEDEK